VVERPLHQIEDLATNVDEIERDVAPFELRSFSSTRILSVSSASRIVESPLLAPVLFDPGRERYFEGIRGEHFELHTAVRALGDLARENLLGERHRASAFDAFRCDHL
jgi:hypothetical protein